MFTKVAQHVKCKYITNKSIIRLTKHNNNYTQLKAIIDN